MLSDYTPMPTLPTKDLARARQFYEQTLGFGNGRESDEGVVYGAGASSFLVYPSSFAGSNRATSMSFNVDAAQFDEEVTALRTAGIAFDTFEMEGLEWQDGVALMGDAKSVWFSDPDGNILNVATAFT